MGSLNLYKPQTHQEDHVIYVPVMGENVTEEEVLDMNVLLFCSSLNICC